MVNIGFLSVSSYFCHHERADRGPRLRGEGGAKPTGLLLTRHASFGGYPWCKI
jgi:hypothetical protein